jgi:hypothetical protein
VMASPSPLPRSDPACIALAAPSGRGSRKEETSVVSPLSVSRLPQEG